MISAMSCYHATFKHSRFFDNFFVIDLLYSLTQKKTKCNLDNWPDHGGKVELKNVSNV